MTGLHASTFPEGEVRRRAREGAAAVFPPTDTYGSSLLGADPGRRTGDAFDETRIVPPVFMPERLERLIDLGREPMYSDVVLDAAVGGFSSRLPLYVSAFGSTQVANSDLGIAVSTQAGRAGIPMVIGENVVPMSGYGRIDADAGRTLLARLQAYAAVVPDGFGGVVVQQSTEDADAEVWNLVYSDPTATELLDSGRLAFELKVGQGAKPGLGGMTVVSAATGERVSEQYAIDPIFGSSVLRCSAPGTFTDEILRQQIRLMRNNFPRARVWVKLHPGRDIGHAAAVAWRAGADAVTVDGAEGGSGWAPTAFLDHVGLPLAECLRRIIAPRQGERRGHATTGPAGCLLASGRMWEGTRAVKAYAMGASAVGLGRAALVAADEDVEAGLSRLLECLELEIRLLISALGKYAVGAVNADDIWLPGTSTTLEGERDYDYDYR